MKRRRIPGPVVLATVWGILGVSTLTMLTWAEEPASRDPVTPRPPLPYGARVTSSFTQVGEEGPGLHKLGPLGVGLARQL
jgi:hypothetical protein